MTTVRFQASAQGFNHPAECAICYEPFEKLEEAKALPCTSSSACPSVYHASCIEKWLRKDPSCPLCRRSFPELDFTPTPLSFGHEAPLVDPGPISNPFRAEAEERFLSARELASRYRAGPSWRQALESQIVTARLAQPGPNRERFQRALSQTAEFMQPADRRSQSSLGSMPLSIPRPLATNSERLPVPSHQVNDGIPSRPVGNAAQLGESMQDPCNFPWDSNIPAALDGAWTPPVSHQEIQTYLAQRRPRNAGSLRPMRSLSEVVLQRQGRRPW